MKLNKIEIVNNKKRYYYDITIPNNLYINPTNAPIKAEFLETRDQSLFDDEPDKYNLSVIRFSVPSVGIPYQIVPVIFDIANPLNPNKMAYSVSLKYLGVVYRQYLQWETQLPNIPIPLPPLYSQVKSELYPLYYSLYSLNHFCVLANKALNLCFQNNIVPLLPVGSYKSPYFTFQGDGLNLISLWTSDLFLDTAINPINIGGNYLFGANIESAFDGQGLGFNNPDGLDFRIICLDRGNNKIVDGLGFLYQQITEFDISGLFEKFQSLIFTSASLPVTHDILSNNVLFDNFSSAGSVAGGFLPIITDFEVDNSTVNNLKGSIHYVPTAEFRRINLRGKDQIRQIDVSVFWKDVFGNIYPIFIPINNALTIKILFEEK